LNVLLAYIYDLTVSVKGEHLREVRRQNDKRNCASRD